MALRKDSIGTTIALWEDEGDDRVSGEVAPFGGGRETEVMDGIVDFFDGIVVVREGKGKRGEWVDWVEVGE